ncbi:hypothetical protein JCM33374_g2353 [Metschnikowia sp. JCM 33374]|nr:hypothetical protein JCM33374_g2353 [Metschnikowia sp. JCM 33374]
MSVPPSSDIETGVSNGDVDWLFRGKSKKLEKKLNSDKKPSLSVSTDRPDVPEKDINSPKSSAAGEKLPRPSSALNPGPANGASTLTPEKTKSPQLSSPATKIPEGKTALRTSDDTKTTGQSSPDAGRSRSSSAPQLPKQPVAQQSSSQTVKRRSSMNLATPSSSSSSSPLTPKPASPSQPVSRSNSGKGRSFFSSLSSKFKSASSSSPSSSPTTSANGAANTTSRTTSPTSTSIPSSISSVISSGLNVPKTPSANGHSSRDQDLASSVKKPPQEIGMPINAAKPSRRPSLTSLTSSSPRSSVEKERGGFFKRRISGADSTSHLVPAPQAVDTKSKKTPQTKPLSRKPELRLRRVSFALDKLENDPQQQIPSRRPRKGNVLIPEDLKAPAPRLALGISTTDGSRSSSATEPKYSEREMQLAIEAQSRALLEAEKHAMEAHLSAKKLAYQIASYKTSNKTSMANVEEDEVAEGPGNIEIDNPLHMHENHFEDASAQTSEDEEEELSPETVYTRCCHLREILPIPATLKQLKHKSTPLQILKMLNPKPTLIDVLSFSDFIAITPINTVIFDNVTMTTEMLKHVLAGLVHNKYLEKLSLRNVAIDEVGWGYVCEFLSRNRTVKKLDVSQQRVKNLTKSTSLRSSMNWNLFIESIKARNGIDELVMGGCKLSDVVFENLLENALTISTCRLGVAATEINVRKCEMLADWISRPNSKCVGIDIAYNDLSQGQLQPFIEAFNTKVVNLVFFSLNSTSLTNVEEVGELLKGLARLKSLRFFDFSSLPQLFPHVISKLGKNLPNFESLRRIHFDLNELSSQSIAALADVFPKVQNLVHVSLLGNKNLDRGSIGALYTAVKSSSIFTLDLDYDLVPDELSQRLALYLMKNFDKAVKPNINDYSGDNEQDDVMFDGSLLMETAEKMLTESDQKHGEVDVKLQKIITNALIERTNSVRKEMHRVIDTLFEKRSNGNLSFEGKENLLRFCLLDASLEKLVHMFEQKAMMFSSTPLSPSPSIKEEHTPNNIEIDREQLHEGSSALIAAGPILMAGTARSNMSNVFQGNESTLQPHSVVIDANSDGRNVIIDNLTGRPILMKSVSQTSLYAKEQEEEEGEFLRWGYFMEHRGSADKITEMPQADENKQEVTVFGAVPSGSELREAIIDAKGVESVTDLISKINNQRVSLDKIYRSKSAEETISSEGDADTSLTVKSKSDGFQDASDRTLSDDDNASIDSSEGHDVHPVVDEAYDKLLNEAQRVMSNK